MKFLSQRGFTFVNLYVDSTNSKIDKHELSLSIAVNGETFFLSEDYLEELTRVLYSTDSNSEISFGIHLNEEVIIPIISPVEHLIEDLLNYLSNYIETKLLNVGVMSGEFLSTEKALKSINDTLKQVSLTEKTDSSTTRISVNPLV